MWTVWLKYFLTTWKKVMGKQHPVCQLHYSTAFISTTYKVWQESLFWVTVSTTLSVLFPGWNLVILSCSHDSKNKIIFATNVHMCKFTEKKLKEFQFNHRTLLKALATRIQQGLWCGKGWSHKHARQLHVLKQRPRKLDKMAKVIPLAFIVGIC